MRKLTLLFFTLSLLLAVFSCGKEPVSNDNDNKAPAPKVLSCSPADGAKDLEPGEQTIVLSFDQNIEIPYSTKSRINFSPAASVTSFAAEGYKAIIKVASLAEWTTYTMTMDAGAVKGIKTNQEPTESLTLTFTTKGAVIADDPYELPTPGDNDAWKQLEKLGLGWNLGNQFDAFYSYAGAGDKLFYPDETCWGNPKVTKQTFTKVKEMGFKTVRIPVTWLKMIGEAPEYKIDETWMARIKEVVGWARDAGLNVLINTHHDEDHYYGNEDLGHRWLNIIDATSDESVNKQIKDKIKGVWTNIANEFKDEGDYLIFEGFNEINDGKWGGSANTADQAKVLNQWNQVFVDAVRATGGNNATRWLGVPTYCAGPTYEKYFVMPKDPANRTMLAVHSYDPYQFTLADGLPQKKWGHTFNGKPSDEKSLRTMFETLYNKYVAKGTPVYLGEFGCSFREYGTPEWRNFKYYLEFYVKAAHSYGIPCMLWDNGAKGFGSERHSYIDHGTGDYVDHSKEVIDVMVNAMNNTDKSYTLPSVYNNAPKS